MMSFNGLTRCIAAICVLTIAPGGSAQGIKPLKLITLEGEGGFNDVRLGTAHDLVVEVRDDANQLVGDAKVVFSAPSTGASVTFADGSKTYIATTDGQGRASVRGLKPTPIEGRFAIQVTASSAGHVGRGTINLSNSLAGGKAVVKTKSGGNVKWVALAIVAGGLAAGLTVGLGGSSSTVVAAPTPTFLTIGSVSVGGPR